MLGSRWPLALLPCALMVPAAWARPADTPAADRDRALAYALLGRHMKGPRLGEVWYRRGGQTLCGLVRNTPGDDDAGWRMFLIVLKSSRSLVEPPREEEARDKRLVLEKLQVLADECD